MEVASAKYMQTLYWDRRKSADPASNVLEQPERDFLDPAAAAHHLALQQALATGQAPPSSAAVASTLGRKSGEPVGVLQDCLPPPCSHGHDRAMPQLRLAYSHPSRTMSPLC